MPIQTEILNDARAPRLARAKTRQVKATWISNERCPACHSTQGDGGGMIPEIDYVFGSERIPLPDSGIAVRACNGCGLVYKSMVPTPAFLAGLIERQTSAKLMEPHDFKFDASVLRRMMGRTDFDLLDVGGIKGELLRACADSGLTGRRSTLDVVRSPAPAQQPDDEFIAGFLDAPTLQWSGDPYDVVTLFDVLEHFNQPHLAFKNLCSLLRDDGLVLLESGNTENFRPTQLGVHAWRNVRRIEHHVFWCREALETIAAKHGFGVVYWNEGRCMSGSQRGFPWARDHFQACLRRK